MTETRVRSHSEIPERYTWNAPSVFASAIDWETELQAITAGLGDVTQYAGRLTEGPGTLADAFEALQALLKRAGKVYVYAAMTHAVDTRDQAGTLMEGRAQGLFGQVFAAISFLDPELLALGKETAEAWIVAEPRLAQYAHYVDNLFRKQAHVRSAEVEEMLGMLAEPFSGPSTTYTMLSDADFHFPPARTADGGELPVTQGTLDTILAGGDREARRTAWEGYRDIFLGYKNTLAANLGNSIKQNTFNMRARRYPSTLEASLFDNNIPVTVFHNLINTFRQNLPTWHRYWRIRRKALGVESLHPYDIWAPLAQTKPHVSFEQAVDWISEGLAPMGQDYVTTLRRGCLEDRWIDVYPCQGKTAGAFSSGWNGTHPFILMSFDNMLINMSTLAHELGHSMHSYLTWQNQPMVYSDYSLFVAEVASNFHQAMVRAHLLESNPDPVFQMNVIEEAMNNFHRYFFIMPTLARFELEVHQRIERGEGLTADEMVDLMADLFTEGYGGEVQVDRPRVGITWATFGHLFADYYVYQYATGISAAHALSRRILSGQPGAVDNYLSFLKAGSSIYPLDALKMAGVDLTTPQPVEETFAVLGGLVDRLEKLVG